MTVLQDIENNFSNLKNYKLINNNTNFGIFFEYIDNLFNLIVDKDLKYLFLNGDKSYIYVINLILAKKRDISGVLKIIKDNFKISKKSVNSSIDSFGLFRNINVFNKGGCNYKVLCKNLEDSNCISNVSRDSIPKELLFSKKCIVNMLINEIRNVNKNKSHNHYIVATDEPYKFNVILNISKDKIEYSIKLLMLVDPELYPFYPPVISYVSPDAKKSFVYHINNLNILKVENWNPIITLDWFFINLSKAIDDFIPSYLNTNDEKILSDLDKELINYSTIIGEKLYPEVNIDLSHSKFVLKGDSKSNNKYWNSGVGYGYSGRDEWDINSYIKDQDNKNNKITSCLKKINNLVNNENIDLICSSSILGYVENNVVNSTLLEIDKIKKLFEEILVFIKKVIPKLDGYDDFKLSIFKGLDIFRNDISPIIDTIDDDEKVSFYMSIIVVVDYIKEYINFNKDQSVSEFKSESVIENYNEMIRLEQEKIFCDYKILESHRFYKHKSSSINPKSLVRISSEFSTMRKNLPVNWDSSIVVRGCSENLNIFSFIIIGPKDTPYHNGTYEFHAMFPKDYPHSEPKVLLDTTGNGTVRFNPNLYDCGKVCLSLLGTWSGQDGESWNKDTSTFLQVLVSIQSLILVEQPYFNEPGWEKQMHTETGKKKAFDYNDNLRLQNLKWAIIDKLENPPVGFENLILEHFKFKRDEILETANVWLDESISRKQEIEKCIERLVELYKKMDV